MGVRKRTSTMTSAERTLFKKVMRQLIKAPGDPNPCGVMVEHHANMMHNMHGSMGPVGAQRFLPWHRVYLLKLERMGQAIDSSFFIPYWDWTMERKVPSWLVNFRPTVKVTGPNIPVVRNPQPGNLLPTTAQINAILNRPTYTQFTVRLEGSPMFGGPHNFVHMWVNGTMSDLRTAPADSLFWLHHANVDRLWSIWQAKPANAGKNPSLTGNNRIMDPWTESEEDVRSIADLGYSYVP